MIDWEGMAKLLVSEEARKEFANLRHAFDEVNHDLQTKFSQVKVPILNLSGQIYGLRWISGVLIQNAICWLAFGAIAFEIKKSLNFDE